MRKWGIHKNCIAALFLLAGVLTGCGLGSKQEGSDAVFEGVVVDQPGQFDSADTAIVVGVDETAGTFTFEEPQVKKRFTLEYNGATCFYDKFGNGVTAGQIKEGDIVDITFYKPKKRLNTLQKSPGAWTLNGKTGSEIQEVQQIVSIGTEKYALAPDYVVFSNKEELELMDLNAMDTLAFQGIGQKVYSIVVEKGHGYLRLQNDEYFYGGWIEVGEKVIQQISENMLLVVPEGTSNVLLSNHGVRGEKSIQVKRNEEVVLDIGDLKADEPEYGTVIFTITPNEASLYIDGKKTDFSAPVRMEYGIHQMIVRSDGYDTVTQYLRVGKPSAGIHIDLTESGKEVDADADTTVSGNNATPGSEVYHPDKTGKLTGSDTTTGTTSNTGNADTTSTEGYYVSLTGPSGVEVYVDGNYIGMAPINFKKEAGQHTVTLRKSGYTAKSYTIQVDNEQKNISYAFPDLIAEQ